MGWRQAQGWLSSCHEAEQQLGQDKGHPVPWDVPGRSLLVLQLLLLQPRGRKGPDPACPGSLDSTIPWQAAA